MRTFRPLIGPLGTLSYATLRRDLLNRGSMGVRRILKLCNSVEGLAYELDRLNARGRSGTASAVLMRMKLAALTADLVAADLIERVRQTSVAPTSSNS